MDKNIYIIIAILILVAFMLGAGSMLTSLHYKGLLRNTNQSSQILGNLPLCLQKGLVPNKDEKNIISALISYNETMLERLTAVESKITTPLYLNVIKSEILRETEEAKTLKQIYKKLYKEEYTPTDSTKYLSADNYILPKNSSERLYLDIFRANLWHVERDYYSLILVSNSVELQKIGEDFALYKVKTLQNIQSLAK